MRPHVASHLCHLLRRNECHHEVGFAVPGRRQVDQSVAAVANTSGMFRRACPVVMVALADQVVTDAVCKL